MTKTPEELTEEWKAGELPTGDYYIKFENGEIERQNNCIGGFLMSCNNRVVQILAPVPTYGEYKAMQTELAEFKRSITSYIGKPIDYDIACETVNKLLDDKKKLKKELLQRLGSDIDYLDTKKMILIIENNKLRGLLKSCREILEDEGYYPTVCKINAAIGESEEI